MGQDREDWESRTITDQKNFEALLNQDRKSEREVGRRMILTWVAAVAVIVLWLVVERISS